MAGKLIPSGRAGAWAQHPRRRAGPAAPQVPLAALHQLTQTTRNAALRCGIWEELTWWEGSQAPGILLTSSNVYGERGAKGGEFLTFLLHYKLFLPLPQL